MTPLKSGDARPVHRCNATAVRTADRLLLCRGSSETSCQALFARCCVPVLLNGFFCIPPLRVEGKFLSSWPFM